uniref:Uncharacterized protein n=1 Tax=Anguilla anguilla TaxID=7936 RepID=A0A0E9V0U7_ANGAN
MALPVPLAFSKFIVGLVALLAGSCVSCFLF